MNIFGIHICGDELNALFFSIPHIHAVIPWLNSIITKILPGG